MYCSFIQKRMHHGTKKETPSLMTTIHDASTIPFDIIKTTIYLKNLEFRISEYEKVPKYIDGLKGISGKEYVRTLVPMVPHAHDFLVDAKVKRNIPPDEFAGGRGFLAEKAGNITFFIAFEAETFTMSYEPYIEKFHA